MWPFDNSPDRTWRNNDSDGETFYGYDRDDGKTAWYNSRNELDSITDTPDDWEQDMNDSGY